MSGLFDPPPPFQGPAADEDKLLVIIGHIFAVVALILWLVNKDNPAKAYLIDQAKESTNFGITVVVASFMLLIVGAVPLIGWLFGIFAFPLFGLAVFVLIVLAVINAANGKAHRYPFALRLIK